jgi:DHA1 family tetracycline resistance protein-like MFS transporter
MAGFGIVLPALPYHVQALGGSGLWVGLLLAGYALAQFAAAPVLGALSDRFGRRPLLLVTLIGSAVSMGLSAVAGSLVALLAARILAGGCGGAIAVGQAYAVDLVPARQRTRALGLVGAAVGLGFVAGPAIGAGLAAAGIGFSGSCLIAAALAGVNVGLGAILLPRADRGTAAGGAGSGSPVVARLTRLARALRQRSLGPAVGAVFLGMAGFAALETTLALLVAHRFGHGPAVLGGLLAGVGIATALTQAGLVGRLTTRYRLPAVGAGGAVALGIGLLALPLAPVWLAYPSLGLVAVGHGLLSTCAAALIARSAGADLGGVLGAGQSAGAAARAVVPLAAGVAFDAGPALPYVLGALACAGAAGLLYRPGQPGRDTGRGDGRSAGAPTGQPEQLVPVSET